MNLCPSLKNLITKKAIETYTDKDNFISDKFYLIDDEKTAYLKYIGANTPIPFSILMLGCHKWKDQSPNYCEKLFNPQAIKSVCELNITDYTFFFIKRWFEEKSENKPNDVSMYILAFVRYSKDEKIYQKIIDEVKKTAEWLSISGNTIQCYVFFYSVSFLYDTSDRGTLKKYFNDQNKDPKYIFQVRYVPPNKKPQYLSVNGAFPQFTIEVQEI